MAHTLMNALGGPALGGVPRREPSPGSRLLVGAALVLVVVLTHAWLVKTVGDGLAQMTEAAALPPRVQVRYVREMVVAAPAANAPTPRQPTRAKTAQAKGAPLPRRLPEVGAAQAKQAALDAANDVSPEAVAQAASAPDSPGALAALTASGTPGAAPSMSTTTPAAEASPQTNGAPQAVDSVWPQTTRVSYAVHGYLRGEIHGNATVEWVRQGDRYQMHMDVKAGAGLAHWSTTSQGRITEQGTQPERYDETTQFFFASRRATVKMGEQEIEFAQGRKIARPSGVQDINSQFVQLTYLFTTRPELAEPGQRIEFPLAFQRSLRAYAYEVQAREVLKTPLGLLDTVPAVPRRVEAKAGDLVAQAWFAPQLHYLPVRIHITYGPENFIELNISKAPELAR